MLIPFILSDGESRTGARLFRTFLRFLVASLYRIEIKGGGHVPASGPVLFVSNHISYADPLVISAATAQPIRFLMWRSIYEYKPLNWFFRLMREIPISPNDSPRKLVASLKEARHALQQGERVGLFAEGAITRFSQTRGFRNGMEHIVRDLDVVILPTHIDRMWGSIFSFERGRFIWKMPRISRLPITISFGAPLPSSTPTHAVRQAVMELGCEAFEDRMKGEKHLHETFLIQARKSWSAPCLVDDAGMSIYTYGQLAVAALILARRWRRTFRGDVPVGLLLPTSPSSTVALLSLLIAGKTPVPLNPALSKEKIEELCANSGITRLITTRALQNHFKFPAGRQMFFMDDVPAPSPLKCWAFGTAFQFLPWIFQRPHETAAILFSTTAESAQLPVKVPHAVITASLVGLQEVLPLTPKDTVTSAVPMSDSLAFTAAFWWPLRHGAMLKQQGEKILVEERFELTRGEPAPGTKTIVPILSVYSRAKLSMICVSAIDVKEGDEDQKGGKEGTVGRPVPGVAVRIVDPVTGQTLPPGNMGLLMVKSTAIGNLLDSHSITNGWFNTGDHASCDEEGFITFPRRALSGTGAEAQAAAR